MFLDEASQHLISLKRNLISSQCCHHRRATLVATPCERLSEEILHGQIVKENPTKDSEVPYVVTTTDVIKSTSKPSLGNSAGVDDGTDEIDQD